MFKSPPVGVAPPAPPAFAPKFPPAPPAQLNKAVPNVVVPPVLPLAPPAVEVTAVAPAPTA